MYFERTKEELMCDSKEESLSWRKSKPADEEAEGPMTEPRYFWGMRKRVGILLSEMEKDIGLSEPETIDTLIVSG